MTLKENLRKLQAEKGLTNEVCAEEIGIHVSTWSKWRSGKHEPSLFYAVKVANFFGVSLDALVGR